MAKQIEFKTPPGKAVYPKITQPDTFGEYADNKYKTYLEFEPKVFAKVEADLKALSKQFTYKVKTPKLPIKEMSDGTKVLVFKSKFLPNVYDASNNKLVDKWNPPSPEALKKLRIGGGSIIRVGATPFAYDKGLSLQLATVQLIKLVGGDSGSSPFEETEGYDGFAEAEADGFGEETASEADETDGEEDIDL